MTDKELSELNEQEFDCYLEEMAEKPPVYLTNSITPWRRAMNRVLWGIGLTMMTLNFLGLDVILPAIGRILLLLGFRALCRENKWFRTAYVCCWIRLIWWLLAFTVGLSVSLEGSVLLKIMTVCRYVLIIPEFLTVLGLRNGVRTVQQKAGLPPHGGNGLLVWWSILLVFALANYSGILGWGFLVAYPFLLYNLYKLSRELDQAGYSIGPSPVRISDLSLKIGYGVAIAVCLVTGYGFLNRYPMDWQPMERTQADSARQELESLGFPGYVLDDMTQEEILSCRGAEVILVTTDETMMQVDHWNQKPLLLTNVALQFPEEREKWTVIHHFYWQEDPDFCGTESLEIWPSENHGGWTVEGDFRGRVICDRAGETVTSPYYSLGRVTYEKVGFLPGILGQESANDVYAVFSYPAGTANARGYVMYNILEMMDGCIIDAWCNYAHQYSRLQYPVQTAAEFQKTYFGNINHAFHNIYNQILIWTHEEEPELVS